MYLLQHCEGKAKSLIEFCLLLDPVVGYQKAKETLKENYGRKNVIARAYVKRLADGPKIKLDDSTGMTKLAQEVQECEITLSHLNYYADLNNFDNIAKIINRLPYSTQSRWIRSSAFIERGGRDPSFSDLVKFVKEEAEVVRSSYAAVINSRSKKTTNGKIFTTKTTSVEPSQQKEKCILCGGGHAIFHCTLFRNKTKADRLLLMRQKRLCDNCGKKGHIAKFCFQKSACSFDKCELKHHALLHREVNRSNPIAVPTSQSSSPSSNCASTYFTGQTCGTNAGSVYLNVVPVCVAAGNKRVNTYAFLDQGSTTTLCDHRLLEKLDLKGEPTEFTITTVNEDKAKKTGAKVSVTVLSLSGDKHLNIPEVLAVENLPVKPNPVITAHELRSWPHLKNLKLPVINAEVLILIGVDVPEAFWVIEECRGRPSEPYALRTMLGWSLIGPRTCERPNEDFENYSVNFASVRVDRLNDQMERLWKLDEIPSQYSDSMELSKNDRYALKLMRNSKTLVDGHYQVALPWRPGAPQLNNNRNQALIRLSYLRRRLDRNPDLKKRYVETLEGYIFKGYAKPVEFPSEKGWYLPHHPVCRPHQPEKVRVVFDCAASFKGTSLNDQLLKGPDFLGSLPGVLTRFRKNKIALVGDIESMFHQVKVHPNDCDFLRFLWWPRGDLELPPQEYHMQVHLFGATSSPSCCQFCLLESANDQVEDFDEATLEIVRNNFYMDDCLFSVSCQDEAIRLVHQLSKLLENKGFHLRKWLGNDQKVLSTIPNADLCKACLSLPSSDQVSEKILGVVWNFETDRFEFNVSIKEKPLTRRGLLSAVSSLFDPLGFVAPVILLAKLLLQDLCRKKLAWDDPISDDDQVLWRKWTRELPLLAEVYVARCFVPTDFENDQMYEIELHHFADASLSAYGTVSYLRLIDSNGNVYCSLVFGKSRLAPLKSVSIPRLELVAATLAIKVDCLLRPVFDNLPVSSYFWTDSVAVLHLIRNTSRRYPIFVANRISKIEENSDPTQWHFVNGKDNPADIASRGMDVNALINSLWFQGPSFLLQPQSEWPEPPCTFANLPEEFKILKSRTSAVTTVSAAELPSIEQRFSRFSSWFRLKKSVAWLLRLRDTLRLKSVPKGALTVEELAKAENVIIKLTQQRYFHDEITVLSSSKSTARRCRDAMRKLNPVLIEGVLRVGGRLCRSPENFDIKHPVILPSEGHATRLLIEHHHREMGHCGMSHTWTSLRQVYWILRGAATVRRVLNQCLLCKKRNLCLGRQLMADLPSGRVTSDNPPFHHTGVDYFGPFLVKQGRSTVKHYGCIFTCLAVRAVHIEMSYSLSTDAFINVYRRFVSRRGAPSVIYSDNGTNLVGGHKELSRSLQEWNSHQINEYLKQRNVKWVFNPPYASHMGGIWERVIRSIKRILSALLTSQPTTDDSLITLFSEVESIVNSRPLTPVLQDPEANEPLTPNHILLMRPSPSYTPGVFSESDNYVRKKWRQVQYLTDQFWRRWRREYLQTLQTRQKWHNVEQNYSVGDVVLLHDDSSSRGRWPLGRVIETYPDGKGLVRKVLVKTATNTFVRPISKLCRFLEGS